MFKYQNHPLERPFVHFYCCDELKTISDCERVHQAECLFNRTNESTSDKRQSWLKTTVWENVRRNFQSPSFGNFDDSFALVPGRLRRRLTPGCETVQRTRFWRDRCNLHRALGVAAAVGGLGGAAG